MIKIRKKKPFFLQNKKYFSHNATCKASTICKISAFFEDLSFLNHIGSYLGFTLIRKRKKNRYHYFWNLSFWWQTKPKSASPLVAGEPVLTRIYLFKANNGNTRTMCEIRSKLKIKAQRLHWPRSGVFTVNFEHISHIVLVFRLLTLSRRMLAGNKHGLLKYQYEKLIFIEKNYMGH